MVLGVTERNLVELDPFQVKVDVRLPGKPDPSVDLQCRLGDPKASVAAPNLRHRSSDSGVVLFCLFCADQPGGVVDGGSHPLYIDQHVCAPVLDRLETPDRLPELLSLTGVINR